MTTITPEQRQAMAEAGDAPVELADPQTGSTYLLIRSEEYQRLRELSVAGEDRRDHEAWAKLAKGSRDDWARENAY